MSQVFTIEIGGQDLLVHGEGHHEDPGRTSGPPEQCRPPEPASFEVERVELRVQVADDLSPNPRESRFVLLDITDLIEELGGAELVSDMALQAFEDEDE